MVFRRAPSIKLRRGIPVTAGLEAPVHRRQFPAFMSPVGRRCSSLNLCCSEATLSFDGNGERGVPSSWSGSRIDFGVRGRKEVRV